MERQTNEDAVFFRLFALYAPSSSQKGSSISSKFSWVEAPRQGHLVLLKESLGILAISPTSYVAAGCGGGL